ncbi:hypothetical protein PGQ11_002545 [Apiospora arundinis]|uniref:Uncharacterized protein n=1 Tax=Apiospora arundinis TaxID=335852 RepID=A0ABR2JIJ8_9PEZI
MNRERVDASCLFEALSAEEFLAESVLDVLDGGTYVASGLVVHNAEVRLAAFLVLAVVGVADTLAVLGSALSLVLLLDPLDQALVLAPCLAGDQFLEVVGGHVDVNDVKRFVVSGDEVAVERVALREGKCGGRTEEDDGGRERELHCG